MNTRYLSTEKVFCDRLRPRDASPPGSPRGIGGAQGSPTSSSGGERSTKYYPLLSYSICLSVNLYVSVSPSLTHTHTHIHTFYVSLDVIWGIFYY